MWPASCNLFLHKDLLRNNPNRSSTHPISVPNVAGEVSDQMRVPTTRLLAFCRSASSLFALKQCGSCTYMRTPHIYLFGISESSVRRRRSLTLGEFWALVRYVCTLQEYLPLNSNTQRFPEDTPSTLSSFLRNILSAYLHGGDHDPDSCMIIPRHALIF